MATGDSPGPPDLFSVAGQTKYPPDAFIFIQRGLDHTVRAIHGEAGPDYDPESEDSDRHVSGEDLCKGLRDFAISQYGLMARTVLSHMKIYHCEDFGRIVFAMVDAGLMKKTDDDTLADFVDVFEFADAFRQELVLPDVDVADDVSRRKK